MASKFIIYILVLFTCCCFNTQLHAQTDTTSSDTTYVDSSSATQDNYGTSTEGAASELKKFSTKDGQSEAGINERHLPDSTAQKLKKDEDYWYADKEAGKEKIEKKTQKKGFGYYLSKLLSSSIFYYIFWIVVVGAFALLVILYLRTFTTKSKRIRSVTGESVETIDNIFTVNFDELINKALNEQNYRLATRLLFLRLLRSMSEKNIIAYGIDKTNMDYMFELGNTKYSKDFMQASRTYEYVWYGNFNVEQPQFLRIKQLLDNVNQKIIN